jgi:ABC-2 type transport system permease protein
MSSSGGSASVALSRAIFLGFVRDKATVFFVLVFPLMLLVLFGGLFSSQDQSPVEVIQVGDVALVDDLPDDARLAFDQTFSLTPSEDLGDALDQVRKGDVDVAIEQRGDELVAHYTQTEQVRAAVTQGTLRAFVDARNVAMLAAESGTAPPYTFAARRVEDDSITVIQYLTPGLLGWAVAMSASFGAAATLQGWRQSKLLRRLQLSPISTRTIVGARVTVTVTIALMQMSIFIGVGAAAFGLTLTGSWWMAIPTLAVGTLCFMAIGLLAGAIANSAEGAVNMSNALVLPMAFLSGSFFPLDGAPEWVRRLSDILPLKHLNEAMLDVMVRGEGPASAVVPILVLAGFALVVTLIAARLFRWDTA